MIESLDDIYLAIRTINIPAGDPISVKIFHKDPALLFGSTPTQKDLKGQVKENGVATIKITPEILRIFAENVNADYLFNPTINNYYAEVYYYGEQMPNPNETVIYQTGKPPAPKLPKMVITMKSKILRIKNVAGRAIEPQNKEKAVIINDENISEKRTPVKVKINVYFDGTMGNKYNVDLYNNPTSSRETVSTRSSYDNRTNEEILNQHATGSESTSSYKQVLTNIENLYTLDLSDKREKEIKIYVEGVGSIPYNTDFVILGAGLAAVAGIEAKIDNAMAQILTKVSDVFKSKSEYISEAKISTFGFSRGAATARSFVAKRERIALNAQCSEIDIVMPFVGLFDTVSSVSIIHSDVDLYDLKVGVRANKVVHLTAGDEYRKQFALTTIESSVKGGVGYELQLPGDHSDIGGGHKDYLTEKLSEPTSFVDKLIEQGWYSKENPHETKQRFIPKASYMTPTEEESYTTISRVIRNEYRYITLGIMLHFAKQYGEIKYDEEVQQQKYSVKSLDLLPVKDILHNYAVANDGVTSTSAYNEVKGLLLKKLRNKYLHLSASKEGGHGELTDLISGGGRYDELGNPNRERIPG